MAAPSLDSAARRIRRGTLLEDGGDDFLDAAPDLAVVGETPDDGDAAQWSRTDMALIESCQRAVCMVRERRCVDITTMPDVVHLVEEVLRTRTALVLRQGDEDVAVLEPRPPRTRRKPAKRYTEADWEAFRASAGSWHDVDTDKLIAEIYESRRSSRPPVEL